MYINNNINNTTTILILIHMNRADITILTALFAFI